MEYRFLKEESEWKQLEEVYTQLGLVAPPALISPVVGAFNEDDKLVDFIVVTPIYHAGTLGLGDTTVQKAMLDKLNTTLTEFPGSQYYTFINPESTPPEGMTKLPVEVYRRVF